MSNINKILITVLACVFMVCIASVSIVKIVTENKNDAVTTTNQQMHITDIQAPDGPDAEPSQVETSTTTTATANTTTTTTQSAPVLSTQTTATTDASAATGLQADILGKWMDSAGMSGFEFLEGGRVNCTYVDLAQFGVPFDGTASGLYTIEGDTLTVKFSIYTATIKKVYRATVSENELSLYDLEEHETSTYAKVS